MNPVPTDSILGRDPTPTSVWSPAMAEPDVAALGPQTRVDPRVEIQMATFGRVARWVAVAFAVFVLLGVWITPIGEVVPRGHLFVRRSTPAGAAALVTVALGALFAGDVRRAAATSGLWRRVGVALTSVAAAFGVLIIAMFLGNRVDLWGDASGEMPAFGVGVSLLALGVAVPLTVSRKESRVIAGQISSLLVFSLTAMVFVGYLLGDPSLGRLFQRPEISYQEVVSALLTAIGVLFVRPGSGLLSTVSSPGAGGKMLRRFGPVVLLAPALLLFMTETMPAGERIDAVAFVAVSTGVILLVLMGVLVRVIDATSMEASTAGAQAERAKAGLAQEAPLTSNLADVLHLVDITAVDGWDVVTRFRPGHGMVGGDTSVVRTLPDSSFGVVLVDVTGHGAEPAVRAIRIRDLLVHSLALGQDPASALDFIGWAGNDDALASVVVMRLDTATGRARLASAGHPPAIHVGTQTADLIAPRGPLLYLDPSSTFESAEIDLSPGDALVMFSDGVADVQRSRDGLSEPEALADMLLAEGGVAERTADLALGFASPDPSDDQTVVVIFRQP